MKRILLLIVILLSSMTLLHAQQNMAEPGKYKTTATKFVSAYNSGDIKSMCALFTPNLVKLLPQDRMDLLVSVLKLQFGKVTGHKFKGFEKRNEKNVARYNATLERGKLDILVSVNDSNLVDFIWFIPDDKTEAAAKMLQQMFIPQKTEK